MATLLGSPLYAYVLSYGSELEVRLLQHVGSRTSHVGDAADAVVITPVYDHDTLIIPAGSTVSGTVDHVERLGWGFRHAVARIDLNFTRIQLPGGTSLPINARVGSVETSRETVRSADGAIIGINPTANFSTSVSALFTLCNLAEREFRIPILGFKFLAARSPDAEISFPAGTEMLLRVTKNLDFQPPAQRDRTVPLLSAAQIAEVQNILAALPAQQTNRGGKYPSDLVNILVLGDPAQHSEDTINHVFRAAGWTKPESHGVMALYHMFHCAVERRTYNALPMSTLKLNGQTPDLAFEKSLDTFAKRHHVRFWRDPLSGAWLGAATEDIGYKMYEAHITHATDSNIDNERAKIVNDLAFTGCVTKGALIPRDSLKPEPNGSTTIHTDGEIAVLELNSCESPRYVEPDKKPATPTRVMRVARAFGEDIVRSNPFSVGIEFAKSLMDNAKIRDNQRIQAARFYTRPSAVASASNPNSQGSLAVRE